MAEGTAHTTTPEELLKKYWGYKAFRPLQRPIIDSILNGHDTIGLLPTGGGKSICYQVSALMKPGLCLVISPLLALMKDQVMQLRKRGLKAYAVNSTMNYHEIDATLDNCIFGDVKFLFVSPERLTSDLFRTRFERMQVSLIAVDEAHCISEWGYDFRPTYLRIAEIRELAPDAQMLALTASATPEVVNDIGEKLEMKKSQVIRGSFVRENLRYMSLHAEDKLGKLLVFLEKINGSGIVYAGTRRRCKVLAETLNSRGVNAQAYHAGMEHKQRVSVQDRWMKGDTRVVVATNAFGMGIDKSDVRFVVHWDIPSSPESYYQEAGRAGRDEKPAYALMLYHDADLDVMLKKTEDSFPDLKWVRKVYQYIANFLQLAIGAGQDESYRFDLHTFCKRYDLSTALVIHALKVLEDNGYVYVAPSLYNPSRAMFKVKYNSLYDFEIRQPKLGTFIQLLLRSYSGMFDEMVRIDEFELARRLRIDKGEVIKKLQRLVQFNIIEYQQAHEDPIISFVAARADVMRLRLDENMYNRRKDRALEKAQAMSNYARERDRCRMAFISDYFGEKGLEQCGKCDNCVRKKRRRLMEKLGERGEQQMREVLRERRIPLNEMINKLDIPEEIAMKTLRKMVDERILVLHADQTIEWNETGI